MPPTVGGSGSHTLIFRLRPAMQAAFPPRDRRLLLWHRGPRDGARDCAHGAMFPQKCRRRNNAKVRPRRYPMRGYPAPQNRVSARSAETSKIMSAKGAKCSPRSLSASSAQTNRHRETPQTLSLEPAYRVTLSKSGEIILILFQPNARQKCYELRLLGSALSIKPPSDDLVWSGPEAPYLPAAQHATAASP